MNKILYLLVLVLIFSSCSQEEKMLTVNRIDVNDGKSLELTPALKFKAISDSASVLLEPQDFSIIYSGDLKKSKSIYKNERYEIRVLLFQFYKKEINQYQVVLRTFSNDKKIIDSFVLASTKEDYMCDGFITQDLKINKSCDDDSDVIAQINEYGKFIVEGK